MSKDYRIEPPVRRLTERQLLFWHSFPVRLSAAGHARRELALMRKEWHENDLRYLELGNQLTPELDEHGERFAKEILADKTKLIAYAAALRLRGA